MAKILSQLPADIERNKQELQRYVKKDAPRIVGKFGVDHFQENFNKEGFVNGGLRKWPERKTDTGRKILSGETKELQNSIVYKADVAKVAWGSDKVYGSIHNRGGKTKAHEIKPRNKKALKWGENSIYNAVNHPGSNIPKRQFIGHSKELIKKIEKRFTKDISNILNK